MKPEAVMTRNEGTDITLRCEAIIGYVTGSPTWKLKGKTFETNKDNRKDVKRTGDWVTELIIHNAIPSDSGLYVCSALKLEDGKELRKSITLIVKSE